MLIGIDLIWVKVGRDGGIESFVRNLLQGFELTRNNQTSFLLFTSKDNYDSFNNYMGKKGFSLIKCDCYSYKIGQRLFYQNTKFLRLLRSKNIDILFTPHYCCPLIKIKGIKYISVIHDLQAYHYPQYFSRMKYLWLKYAWKRIIKVSDKIVAISQYVKKDIIDCYGVNANKIDVIYNPIVVNQGLLDFSEVRQKYGIEKEKYYYTVSSMLPHKNLSTLLKVMEIINQNKPLLPQKLVISGVSGSLLETTKNFIKIHGLQNNCIIIGFISNEERNTLLKNSFIFLFPSIFEGFGMPIIESMLFGKNVITTKSTCIPEVSKNKAIYVVDPYSVDEWIEKLDFLNNNDEYRHIRISFPEYNLKYSANKYLDLFKTILR